MPAPLAFSPGSITCFFLPRRGPTPESTWSRGCAINLRQGVHAALEEAPRTEILFQGAPVELPTVRHVVERLAPTGVRIFLESELELGCGFGVSAAAALAAAFALCRHFDLDHDRKWLGMLAHEAEVRCQTGLGDVGAQLCGGVVYRRCREGPLDCQRLPIEAGPLAYRVFGSLSTSEMLGDPEVVVALEREGERALRWIDAHQEQVTLAEILDRSLSFAQNAGLIRHSEVERSIRTVQQSGGQATMILLGHSVVASGGLGGGEAWVESEIDLEGTRMLS